MVLNDDLAPKEGKFAWGNLKMEPSGNLCAQEFDPFWLVQILYYVTFY